MREAKFRKKGKPVICDECGKIWVYRGKQRRGWITCPGCRTKIRVEDSLLPTGR